MSIAGLCRAVGVSRAGYYRQVKRGRQARVGGVELHAAVQAIALEMPAYGYRRVTAELKQRGWAVNHKRVLRVMRQDNLLCLRRRRFVRTTNSDHSLPVYRNLAAEMVLTGIDQLWVADITYIRLESEFVYLAVILDAYSRRVIGCHVGATLRTELVMSALEQALSMRRVRPGLVHHSDRGIQYASQAYTERLRQHQIAISMSRSGNPYDNAYAESFMKTLKHEEVHRCEYRSLEEAQERIEQFVHRVYNQKRLHSALGYRSPVQFEQQPSGLERDYVDGAGTRSSNAAPCPAPHPGFRLSPKTTSIA